MPKLRSGEEWAKSLRQDIKTESGLGWNVCGHKRSDGTLSGSCKLTHRTQDGRRAGLNEDGGLKQPVRLEHLNHLVELLI